MAESDSEYISAIRLLHEKMIDAIATKWMPNTPNDPDPKSTWDQILPLVQEVDRLAKKVGMPPLASSRMFAKGEIPSGYLVPDDGDWWMEAVVLRNPQMITITLPVRAQKKVKDQWKPGEFYVWKLAPGQPFDIDCYFYEWVDDLENPPGPRGIRDTGGGDCKWETHIRNEERKEVMQLKFSLGIYPLGTKRPEDDAEYKQKAESILNKYEGATITSRYLTGVINSYMRKLNSIIDGEEKKIAVVPAQLRNISQSIRSILTDAMPLKFSDAPDFPASNELNPREAIVILDRLRKCIIRREEKSLGKPTGNAKYSAEEIVVTVTPKPPSDGPKAPNIFEWKSQRVALEPIPWRLLNFVWNTLEQTCPQDEAYSATWGEDSEKVTTNAIGSALRKINAAFAEVEYGRTISQKSGWFVIS